LYIDERESPVLFSTSLRRMNFIVSPFFDYRR
jgi:hypothetical protein